MFYEKSYVLFEIVCLTLLLFKDSEGICGRPAFPPRILTRQQIGNRISNGIEARKHSLPWQALVITKGYDSYKRCGGSLLHWNDKNASAIVLTAAHCVIDDSHFEEEQSYWQAFTNLVARLFQRRETIPLTDVDDLIVLLGLHTIDEQSSVVKTLRVAAISIEEYNKTSHAGDIALLKLEREVLYDDFIQGICLPNENEDLPPPESPCLVAGWGRLGNGQSLATLQQLQTYIVNGQVLSPLFQEKRMICTGNDDTDAGARKGDSGGPLVCLKNDTFFVYGVISFRFFEMCAELRHRQAFTKVAHYLHWIRNTLPMLSAT